MTNKEAVFLESMETASEGKDGSFEFSCPHCGGYCIGVRKSWFNSILANCMKCGLTVRGNINTEIKEKGA